MDLATRKVPAAGVASVASGLWMSQIGRNMTGVIDCVLRVEREPPLRVFSNWRDRPEHKNQRNVADTVEECGRRCCQDNGRAKLGRGRCGPQSGHVSNCCCAVGLVIEPVNASCSQNDLCEPATHIHAGHPDWTRLVLAVLGPTRLRMHGKSNIAARQLLDQPAVRNVK